MNLDNLTSISSPTSGVSPSLAPTKEPGAMGKEEFLKLFLAQLQHQDPTSPLENQEFVAQLATFSGLEQQIQTNEALSQLQLGQSSIGSTQLASFIGREIVARSDSVRVAGGRPDPVSVSLDADAAHVKITITDKDGKVIETIERDHVPAGSQAFPWSGRHPSGGPLPDGAYHVAVEAKNQAGEPVQASALTRGIVTALSLESGSPELLLGSVRILPSQVVSVSDPAKPAP